MPDHKLAELLRDNDRLKRRVGNLEMQCESLKRQIMELALVNVALESEADNANKGGKRC